MDLCGWNSLEDLGGVRGGETIINQNIFYLKIYFQFKKKRKEQQTVGMILNPSLAA